MFQPELKAMVLAAGRGERMRPLTDRTPKPLLPVQGKPLVVWHLEALAKAGVREVVINGAWLEEQLPATLGDGSRFGLRLHYSFEGRDHGGALETAGGIATALHHLATNPNDVFWVVSGDVFLPGFVFDARQALADMQAQQALAHLWLAPNAPHHPSGDFGLSPEGCLLSGADVTPKWTWASVGLFRASMFEGVAPGTRQALRPLLEQGIAQWRIRGEHLTTPWTDVGTVERLQALG